MPKKMKPGKLKGPSHKRGGILLEAEGGEYIIKKSSVKKIGKKALDKINKEGRIMSKQGYSAVDSRGKRRNVVKKGLAADKRSYKFGREGDKGTSKYLKKSKEPHTYVKGGKGSLTESVERKEKTRRDALKSRKIMEQKKLRTKGKMKKGGSVGSSIKTYASGGYVEGK
tara:strand:+ start:652 stop:1158 length:507 start_codon:yes stop_codon:yes gene_type:complete